MKTIKLRDSAKSIKVLDKSVNLSTRMKNGAIHTKQKAENANESRHDAPTNYATEAVQSKGQTATRGATYYLQNPRQKAHDSLSRAKGHFEEVKRNMPKERNHAAEQAQKVAKKTKENAENLRKASGHAKEAAQEAKANIKIAKYELQEVRQSGRQTMRDIKQKTKAHRKKMPSVNMNQVQGERLTPALKNETTLPSNYLSKGIHTKNQTNDVARSVKGLRESGSTIKTTKKSVKTAQRTAKETVKAAKQTAKASKKSTQVAAKTAKAAQRSALAASKAAAKAAKATAKSVAVLVKISIAAIKGLVALVAAGGWIAVTVILIICMIGLMMASVFGIFFSGEPTPGTGRTINSVIAEIDTEYQGEIDEIISANTFDLLDMSGARASWREVLAVYTVKVTGDPDTPMEVATVDDTKASILRQIFWDMNAISYSITTTDVEEDVTGEDGLPTGEIAVTQKRVLRITTANIQPDEMAQQYRFTERQKRQLEELLKPDYFYLWNALLYGITTVGDASMVEIALTQLGNVGGEPYWQWYGFTSRVEWCATFVSWVAEQCGFIDAGIIPRFSGCMNGIQWFKNKGQWQNRHYIPSPGDLIFFDWDGDSISDHVGIVESVSSGRVNTIEGNTSDSVAQRSYDLGSVKVYGYATPAY